MGQAKNRGSFEERQAAAIERRRIEAQKAAERRAQAEREEAEWLASLPQERRARILRARTYSAQMLATLAGLVAGMGVVPDA